jgi:hypothetical protein
VSPAGRSCEFLMLAERLGIDPGAMVNPGTELSFALARGRCGDCPARAQCRAALAQPDLTLSALAPFCPNVDVLVELISREPHARHRSANLLLSDRPNPR